MTHNDSSDEGSRSGPDPRRPGGAEDSLNGQVTPAAPSHSPASPPAVGDISELGAPTRDGGGSFEPGRYVATLFRFKWVIVLAVLVGLGSAYLVWDRVEPDFVARGSLWVQAGGAGDDGPIVTDGLLQAQSWLDLLESNAVLDTVAIEEGLYLAPGDPGDLSLFEGFVRTEDMVPGTYRVRRAETGNTVTLLRDGELVDQGEPGDELGETHGFIWTVPDLERFPDREVRFSLRPPRSAANRLRQDLSASMDARGSFIRLELRGQDRSRVADVLNSVMERYVDLAADLKRAQLDEEAEVLEEQLQQAEAELREAERELEDFRVQTITLPSDEAQSAIQPGLEMTRDPAFQEFFDTRLEQDQVQRDRQRLEEVLAQGSDAGISVQSLEFIPSVERSSELLHAIASLTELRGEYRELMQRYSPDHPPVQEVRDRLESLEAERLPALTQDLVEQLRREEERLEARIAASGANLSEIPPRAIEEARLRRRVAIGETLYTELRQRYETASLARASSAPDLRILDPAAPPEFPSNDQRARLALMAFAGFLGLGIGGAFLAERLDPRLRSPEDVSGRMGLNILGTIPRLHGLNRKRGIRNGSAFQEALRELRTNLGYAYGAAGSMIFTISSTGREEGKTLISASLAASFSELGRRVIVVDADTRRGDLHEKFEGQRRPGLTDYLRSPIPVTGVIRHTRRPGLDFIPAGVYASRAPELLSSATMRELLSVLRKHYDVVIVDSPPFGAGADPVVLSAITGHLLMVIRSGSTHGDFVQAKLEPLARVPVRVLGAVLNDHRPGRFGPHYGYYGSYLSGYESGADEEEDSDLKPGRLPPVASKPGG